MQTFNYQLQHVRWSWICRNNAVLTSCPMNFTYAVHLPRVGFPFSVPHTCICWWVRSVEYQSRETSECAIPLKCWILITHNSDIGVNKISAIGLLHLPVCIYGTHVFISYCMGSIRCHTTVIGTKPLCHCNMCHRAGLAEVYILFPVFTVVISGSGTTWTVTFCSSWR